RLHPGRTAGRGGAELRVGGGVSGIDRARFVMCVNNKGQEQNLTIHKVYRVIPDGDADRLRMVRIIDDSGEDYMHPARWFVPVSLSAEAERSFELVTMA